jgi:hemerythrin
MALVDWRPEFELGVPEVDAQHRRLVELLNGAFELTGERSGTADRVAAAVDDLLKHTLEHFADEERLMASATYPGLEDHKSAHRTLRKRAVELASALRQDGAPGAAELFYFLRGWFEEHIVGEDQRFRPWVLAERIRRSR